VPVVSRQAAMEQGYIAGDRDCGVLQTQYNGQPTYVSQFAHRHPYIPGVVIADQDSATVGPYHNADIPYFFGTMEAFNLIRPTRAFTDADRALSERMMDTLIAFAQTGNPATAQQPWPAWTAKAPNYVVFGGAAPSGKMNLARIDWINAHPFKPVEIRQTGLRAHD